MTTYSDLSECDYFPFSHTSGLLAVGWLGADQEFSIGEVSDQFLLRLAQIIQNPWSPPVVTGGAHSCELCHQGGYTSTKFKDYSLPSASSMNLFVPFDGKLYVAPEGIGHYIFCHRYRPPGVFIEAVLSCPPVRSIEFKKLLLSCGGREILREVMGKSNE